MFASFSSSSPSADLSSLYSGERPRSGATLSVPTRMFRLHHWLPLDLNVYYHKSLGVILVLLSLVHSAIHLGKELNTFMLDITASSVNVDVNVVPSPTTNTANLSFRQFLLSDQSGLHGTVPGLGYPTGLGLLLVLGTERGHQSDV